MRKADYIAAADKLTEFTDYAKLYIMCGGNEELMQYTIRLRQNMTIQLSQAIWFGYTMIPLNIGDEVELVDNKNPKRTGLYRLVAKN